LPSPPHHEIVISTKAVHRLNMNSALEMHAWAKSNGAPHFVLGRSLLNKINATRGPPVLKQYSSIEDQKDQKDRKTKKSQKTEKEPPRA
jgi:hypothetical protein